MALDHLRRIAADGNALDYIGIKCTLSKESVATVLVGAVLLVFRQELLRRLLKYLNEFVADDFSFLFRISYSLEFCQETFRSINILESNVKIFAEDALHDFFLARAQQTVVDENTGKPIGDRVTYKRGYHRRIVAAARTHDSFVGPDLATEMMSHLHQPIADSKNRNP